VGAAGKQQGTEEAEKKGSAHGEEWGPPAGGA